MLPDPPVYVTEDDKNWVLCGMRITLYSNEPDNMVAVMEWRLGDAWRRGTADALWGGK